MQRGWGCFVYKLWSMVQIRTRFSILHIAIKRSWCERHVPLLVFELLIHFLHILLYANMQLINMNVDPVNFLSHILVPRYWMQMVLKLLIRLLDAKVSLTMVYGLIWFVLHVCVLGKEWHWNFVLHVGEWCRSKKI